MNNKSFFTLLACLVVAGTTIAMEQKNQPLSQTPITASKIAYDTNTQAQQPTNLDTLVRLVRLWDNENDARTSKKRGREQSQAPDVFTDDRMHDNNQSPNLAQYLSANSFMPALLPDLVINAQELQELNEQNINKPLEPDLTALTVQKQPTPYQNTNKLKTAPRQPCRKAPQWAKESWRQFLNTHNKITVNVDNIPDKNLETLNTLLKQANNPNSPHPTYTDINQQMRNLLLMQIIGNKNSLATEDKKAILRLVDPLRKDIS